MSRPSQPSARSVPTTFVSPRGPGSQVGGPNVPPGSSATTSVGSRTGVPESSSCRHASTRSRSTIEPPTSRPSATRNVNAIAPPTARTSTLLASDLSTPSLSATLAPPTTATNGLDGSSSSPPSTPTSSASRRPAALGRRVGGPTTDACRRWATPNASLTYASNPSTSDATNAGSSAFSPGENRRFSINETPGQRSASRSRTGAIVNAASHPPCGLPRWLHAVTSAPSASSHSRVGRAARIRKSSTTIRLPSPSPQSGTLKSVRTRTRRPRSGPRSSSRGSPCSGRGRCGCVTNDRRAPTRRR